MKNTMPVSASPTKTNPSSPPSYLTWINALILLSGLAALFFLLTNGIPFIQLGLMKELKSKTRYINTMRISISIFSVLLAFFYSKQRELFNELWVVQLFRKVLKLRPGLYLSVLFILYSLILIGVGFMRHAALETRAFDLGIFAQAVWNTMKGDFLYSSLKGGICLLGDHVSPLLAAIAPLYRLWPDPRLLLVLQTLAAASCLYLIAYISRQKTGDVFIMLVFGLIYCFYLPTRNALHEDFHPEVLIEPLILASFLFLEKKRLVLFLLSLLLFISAKENMLGISFMLGFYAAAFKKQWKIGVPVMAFSMIMLALDVHWIVPYYSGKPYLYQGVYFQFLSGKTQEGIKILLHSDGLEYMLKIFSPFLFLPFLHFPTLILTFPILLQNLLANNPVMRSLAYHYTTGLTPFVFISSIYGFQVLCEKNKWFADRKYSLASLLLVVSLFQSGPSEYYYYWQSLKHNSPHRAMIREKLKEIPQEGVVLTHNNFIPQVSSRKYVYQFDYNPELTKGQMAKQVSADYVIFDQEFWEPSTAPLPEALDELKKTGYQISFEQSGFYILKR